MEPNAASLAMWIYRLDRELKIHSNPAYISSLGEARASVSGSCGTVDPPPARLVADKDPTIGTVAAAPASLDPHSFGRYLLDVARG